MLQIALPISKPKRLAQIYRLSDKINDNKWEGQGRAKHVVPLPIKTNETDMAVEDKNAAVCDCTKAQIPRMRITMLMLK